MPELLNVLIEIVSHAEPIDTKEVIEHAIAHGQMRSEQGFKTDELMREYQLLRQVIFATLEQDLAHQPAPQIIRTFRIVDLVIDTVVGKCLSGYMKLRIQELEQVQSELQLTNQELDRLLDSQKNSLSRLAHEIKSPLTSIIGFSSLLLKDHQTSAHQPQTHRPQTHPLQPQLDDPSMQLGQVNRVLRNARRILHLVNDTLDVARYEDGQIQLVLEPINLREVIAETVDSLQPLAKQKEILVVQALDDLHLGPVYTDESQIRQILSNLIGNAVRYTEQGQVTIRGKMLENDRIEIKIVDTGIGIPQEEMASIFRPFYRCSNAMMTENSSGLGLAIVTQIVELLEGEISFRSEENKGTEVILQLPRLSKTEASTPAGAGPAAYDRALSVEQ